MIASTLTAPPLLPPIPDVPSPDGATPTPSGFASLLVQLKLVAADGDTPPPEAPVVAEAPAVETPKSEANAEPFNSDVPEGLEDIADALSKALTAVLAAAGKPAQTKLGHRLAILPPGLQKRLSADAPTGTPNASLPATDSGSETGETTNVTADPTATDQPTVTLSQPTPPIDRPADAAAPMLATPLFVHADPTDEKPNQLTIKVTPKSPSPEGDRCETDPSALSSSKGSPFPSGKEGVSTGSAPTDLTPFSRRSPSGEGFGWGLQVSPATLTAPPSSPPLKGRGDPGPDSLPHAMHNHISLGALAAEAPPATAALGARLMPLVPRIETTDGQPAPIDPTSPDQPAQTADPLTDLPSPAPVAPPLPVSSPSTPTFTLDAPALQPASTAQIVIGHHLDLARDGEWLDRLARDISRMATHNAQLRFQLNPQHLGSLHVELASSADGTAIRLTADTEAARTILVDAQPRLVAEARAQGLRISGAEVDLGGQGGQQRGRETTPQIFVRTQASAEAPATPSRRSAAERYA
jgi:flagellar hook-length control protein FliK